MIRRVAVLAALLALAGCAQLGPAPRQALEVDGQLADERGNLSALQRRQLAKAWRAIGELEHRIAVEAAAGRARAEAAEALAVAEAERDAVEARLRERREAAARLARLAAEAPEGSPQRADAELLGKVVADEAKALEGEFNRKADAATRAAAALDAAPTGVAVADALAAARVMLADLDQAQAVLAEYAEADAALAANQARLREHISSALQAYEDRQAALEQLGRAALAAGEAAADAKIRADAEKAARKKAEEEARRLAEEEAARLEHGGGQ